MSEQNEIWPAMNPTLRAHITYQDLQNISGEDMLSSSALYVFGQMLKRQYPHACGLQDTLLAQKSAFKSFPKNEFVQILHDGKNLWVSVSTYGCQENEIVYMDSFFNGRINIYIKTQICTLMKSLHPKIAIKVAAVKQQSGGADCGIYALAFVQYILMHKGAPPANINFDQKLMRHHLLRALASDKLDPFPLTISKAKYAEPQKI